MTANVTKMRGDAPAQAVAEDKKEGASAANDHALPARDQPPGVGNRAGEPTGADLDRAVSVREIKEKTNDSRGVRITKVYIKQSDEYAIYKSDGELMVAYADDPDKARRQRKLILPLARDRFELEYFLKGLNCRDACERQLANGLQLALEGNREGAKRTIAEAKTLVLAKRGARGRFQYLYCSGGAAAILMLSLVLAHRYVPFPETSIDIWLAAGAGLVGAGFSIALAIKSRTVALDTERLANATDGVLRLSIGVICAGVLALLAASNVLQLTIGDINFTGRTPKPEAVLIIGFLAGFLERLVPDLLEKATKSTGETAPRRKVATPPAAP